MHKIYSAVTHADDLLRDLAAGREIDPARIRVVRGLLTEWRLESD